MMDLEFVILAVKIINRIYNIRYSSEGRVKELMLEYTTQYKGRLRPRANCRCFISIHCKKANFSNKLRLNSTQVQEEL